MFGVSYGWYAYSNAESKISGTTIKEVPTVIFAQTEYISSSQTMPIYDNDRYNYANKNSFTITINENLKDYQIGIEISLINISMASELKIPNYKYELIQNFKGDKYNLAPGGQINPMYSEAIKEKMIKTKQKEVPNIY